MLKVSKPTFDSDGAAWKLEGRLVGPWVAELKLVAEAALADSSTLALDLSGVTFVDRIGHELLRELIARRVRIEHPSGFVRELLEGCQR